MLTLLLLRHAKADRPNHDVADFDRKLKEKGREASTAVGRYLAEQRLAPKLVLCSPAARTRETWAVVARHLRSPVEVSYPDALYDFGDGRTLLHLIARQPDAASPLMLVGHNPSIEELALHLAAPAGPLRQRMELKYPTAGLAVLRFAIARWADIAPGCGELVAFTRPADLIGDDDE